MKFVVLQKYLISIWGGVSVVCVAVLLKSPVFRNSAHQKSKGEGTSKPHTVVTSVKRATKVNR